jgi:hypothetical protein
MSAPLISYNSTRKCATQSYSIISHQYLFGMIKKKFRARILSGVVEVASLAPLQTRKNSAVARRSSIKAR